MLWVGAVALVLGGLYDFFVHRHMVKESQPEASWEIEADAIYDLRFTIYDLRFANCELRIAELRMRKAGKQ